MARRELGNLAKDLATGNYGRFEQSALTLANASGIMSTVFSATGAAIIGVVAEIGLFAAAANQGSAAQNEFNKAVAQTGDSAGTTYAGLKNMADGIGAATNNASKAKDILLALAANGKVGAQAFESIGQAAFDMAQLTGESAEKAASQAASMFDGTAASLIKANDQYHFLTIEIYDQVAALEKEGDAQKAAEVAATAFHDAIGPRIDDMNNQVTGLAKAWDSVTKSFRGFKEDFLNGAQLITGTADLQTKIYALQGQKMGAQSGNPFTLDSWSPSDNAKLAALQTQLADSTKKADQQASDQQVQTTGIAGQATLDKFLKQYESEEQKRQDDIVAIHAAANKAIGAALAKGDTALANQIMEQEAKADGEARAKGAKKPKADPFAGLDKLVQGAQVFDNGVGQDKADNQQVKDILAIVDAGAKLIASGQDVAKVQADVAVGVSALNEGYAKQADILNQQNVTALKTYQDAIDQQIADKQ